MPVDVQGAVERKTSEHEPVREQFGAPRVFVLAVVDGTDPMAVHRVGQFETVLGRGADADFRVNDEEISKRHCMLRVDGPVVTLLDIESRNGTFVNGREMREGVGQRLRHLDEFQIGGTRIVLLTGRARCVPR